MISVRLVAMASTFFLVTGALLVGDALHGSVVTGQYSVTSPAAVLRAVAGLVSIAVGYRLETPPSEYTSVPSGQSRESTDDAGGDDAAPGGDDFDPDLSPLGDDGLEEVDADEE